MKNSIFKRLAIMALAGLMVMTALTGCGGKKPTNPGDDYEVNIDMSDEDYNQSATLSVGVTADPAETDLINAVAAGFKELFPNVTIKAVKITGDNYISAVETRVKANNVPDLLFTSEGESFRFISQDILLNLKPYINAENSASGSTTGYEDQFVESAWRIGQEDYNGAQMFLPRSSDRIVTHLNMSYITPAITYWNNNCADGEELPLDIVKNGWTWGDFMDVCAALRLYYDSKGWSAASGRYILDHSFTWGPVMFSMFKSNGAVIAENGEWKFTDEGTRKTSEMIRTMVEKGYIAPKNGGGANYETLYGAMLFHSSSAIAKYNNFVGDDYDVVTFPVINGDDGVFGYGVPGYGIYAGIDKSKRDLAWQFLRYIVSAEGQNILARAGMCTPSVRNDLQDYSTAAWGEGYRHLNLEATVYETERNYTENFFMQFNSDKKNAIVDTMSNYIEDIRDYNTTKKEFTYTVDKCLETCAASVKKVLQMI